MIHEIAKEKTNAYFAKLGLPYRVDETKAKCLESILGIFNILKLGI
ncbi:putative conjugative transfer TraA domain protein [Orientia tsutsugamushi str. Gilliam]|uniref:Putative conjugative transfer TraA domain protein n=1 Tax=Orientia tsutsugamushi str. Gilliam TaxID=1359184 RepID=A0A0F3M4I3_ORITS|nr:hypothetical protein [Orientia tsutsugamushi]KJV50596.1 putative conjugative transfer TraA domain protein [Orientia tsutsugamushi str. Gilliam]